MKTQTQHLLLIRNMLDETTERQWTDIKLNAWINEAMRDICTKSEALRGVENVDWDANDQTNSLTSGIVRVHRVEFQFDNETTRYPLQYMDFMNMDDVWWTGQEQGVGVPAFYTTWGVPPVLTLTLYPIPHGNGTARVFKYEIPTDLATSGAGSSNVTVPEGWERLVTEYVVMQAKRMDRDPSWVEAKQMYDESLKELIEVSVRFNDQVGMVSSWSGFGGVPQWLWDDSYA